MQTPKSRAFHLLDRTLVNDSFTEQKVDSIFFALMQRYAPDVTVEMEWPQSFTNPTVTVHFRYTSLREAINTLCMLAHVFFTVTDYGSLRIARPAYSQAMSTTRITAIVKSHLNRASAAWLPEMSVCEANKVMKPR